MNTPDLKQAALEAGAGLPSPPLWPDPAAVLFLSVIVLWFATLHLSTRRRGRGG